MHPSNFLLMESDTIQYNIISVVRLQAAASTSAVAGAMQSAAGAMSAVGTMVDPLKVQKQMAAFSRENERLDMAGEMMDDALFEDSESEVDEIVDQVLTTNILANKRLLKLYGNPSSAGLSKKI